MALPFIELKEVCLPGRKTKSVKLINWNRSRKEQDKNEQWSCSRWGFPLQPAPSKVPSESREDHDTQAQRMLLFFWLKSCTSGLTDPWGSVGAQGEKFLKYRVSLQCVGVCLVNMQWQGPLPDGILAFRCDGVCSVEPPSALLSRQQELWASTAPGHVACRILKKRMTQTNNGWGDALLGLAGTVLVKGRISAGGLLGFPLVLHMAYNRQGQYCVCTFVSPLSCCTSVGTSASLGKYLVSSSVTRTHRNSW